LAAAARWLNLAGGMSGLRDKSLRRLGAALAALALYLQLAFAGGAMLALAAPDAAADALNGHALCLAGGGTTTPAAPADSIPVAPAHEHGAFCCLWHPLPGIAPQAASAPLPIAYAAVALTARADATAIPGPRRGPANARAPPTLA
jgi:hypothetical protein